MFEINPNGTISSFLNSSLVLGWKPDEQSDPRRDYAGFYSELSNWCNNHMTGQHRAFL